MPITRPISRLLISWEVQKNQEKTFLDHFLNASKIFSMEKAVKVGWFWQYRFKFKPKQTIKTYLITQSSCSQNGVSDVHFDPVTFQPPISHRLISECTLCFVLQVTNVKLGCVVRSRVDTHPTFGDHNCLVFSTSNSIDGVTQPNRCRRTSTHLLGHLLGLPTLVRLSYKQKTSNNKKKAKKRQEKNHRKQKKVLCLSNKRTNAV